MQKKFMFLFVLVSAVIVFAGSAECARKRTRTAKSQPPIQPPAGISSLAGTWTAGTGTGRGTDPRQPGVDVSLTAEDVMLQIENVKFSETTGEGRADVIFNGRILDIRNDVKFNRSWEFSIPYDMKKEANNSWSFSSEFVNGEDKITVTLASANTALIRWESEEWDDDYPDEKYTCDVTCSARKK